MDKKSKINAKRLVLQSGMTGFFIAVMAAMAMASGSESKSWPSEQKATTPEATMTLYDQGMKADKAGDSKTALDLFQKALKKDPKNPEIINMIAHSERKLGMVNEAILDYWKALKLRPKFPESREYMGEAYIQAILLELETLKSYGKEGEEQREDLLKAFKKAADEAH
jgi:tetratricopeptide (TPR) repeat protein